MAFGGTLVSYGTATGLVVATGAATELGRISSMLRETTSLETPLTRALGTIGRYIALAIVAISAVILTIGVFRASAAGLPLGESLRETLIIAIALAVGAIPEGLPAIVTISLAIGVQRMARRHAIVRRLAAVETLGSATAIASDKTGTLTRSEMTVRAIVTASVLLGLVSTLAAPLPDLAADEALRVRALPLVPSLDLREPMALGTRGIPPRLDPNAGFRPWFMLRGHHGIPAEPRHDQWDVGDMTGRDLESLIQARHMGVSSPELALAEWRLQTTLFRSPGQDGLVHDPPGGIVHSFSQGSALFGLLAWFEDTGDAEVRQAIERLITAQLRRTRNAGAHRVDPTVQLEKASGSHLLSLCAATDIRANKIYNIFTIPFALFAIAFHSTGNGADGFLFSAIGMAAGAGLLIVPYLMGGMGAGDVKLMGAVGSFLGAKATFEAFILIALAGGVYSLLLILSRRDVFRGFFSEKLMVLSNMVLLKQ